MTTATLPPRRARVTTAPRSHRIGYAVTGTLLTTIAIALAVTRDTGVSSVLAFAILPDIALFLTIGTAHEPGQLPARAVPAYNLLHSPLPPLALAVAATAGIVGSYWLVAGLAWLAHISLDRAAGYGPRTKDGWQRG